MPQKHNDKQSQDKCQDINQAEVFTPEGNQQKQDDRGSRKPDSVLQRL
ncbi:MAG: hypothetical protein TR69_WS6001001472 [candidate division WS6 bacterium OLB20]|uniref:Uncharacterized protein n=1 Tax=candidate division WS6 bacterium OLB20 TaxID=1617426 RepID=A0A136LW42_9BACT|nr:MAG: hypothetical protein TR69_WS6001001472 [candidate division WS6 bacterium OLB20]